MKLKTGLMNNKELAEWFGIKESTFKSNKKKKLEELKKYCQFEETKGKVYILEIYQEEYQKDFSKSFGIIKEETEKIWIKNKLDTGKRISQEIMVENLMDISPATAYTYTLKARNELFGKPFGFEGSIGSCRYLWCKVSGEGVNTKYTPFTEEENKIKKQLFKKYFGDTTEKQLFINEMVSMGELTKEEGYDMLMEISNMGSEGYMAFKAELEEKIGSKISKVTEVREKGNVWEIEAES